MVLGGYRVGMSSEATAPAETGGVQDFIRDRQVGVLERAIETLRTCPDDDLVAQTHRLSGTLGTYQLTEASRAVRDLYDTVRAEDAIPADTPRDGAIAVLVRSLGELRDTTGGTSHP